MKPKVVKSADELCNLIIEMLESQACLTQGEMYVLNYAKETKEKLQKEKSK